MNKKDLLELKRRLKGDKHNIDRLAGCYVDGNGNKVVKLNETFLNLETEETEKYLEIARKALGGTIGNNILELEFPKEEEEAGGKQQFLNGLRSSALNNEELLDTFYDLVIKGYHFDGNYLILLFHDTYDIMTRTSDNLKLDESEEVYEYILCAICPVVLSKPGLGYIQTENRIGARIRDWVVGAPDLGFLFPAFDDRGADIHRVDYFIKDAGDSNPDFIEDVLGCGAKRTKKEKHRAFCSIIKNAYRHDEDRGETVLMEIEDSLNIMAEENAAAEEGDSFIGVDDRVLTEVLNENEVEEESAKQIIENVRREFSDEEVCAQDLVDTKALSAYTAQKRERELVKEVESLRTQLSDIKAFPEDTEPLDGDGQEDRNALVELKVSRDLEEEVAVRLIDEQKYVVIPLKEGSDIRVNGKNVAYE